MKTDIVIVGTGVSGLYCALNLPRDKKIVMVTKADDDKSDSFLAQGGICVLKDENDYDSYFEDTMRAGHYENNKESVDIMIRSSRDVINDLVGYGVRFEKENGEFAYTKEGAHSTSRILFHEDITGKEITSHLLTAVKELDNVTIIENFTMVDIIEENNECFGIIGYGKDGKYIDIQADFTVFAYKARDPVLDQFKIFKGLGHTNHHAIHSYRMYHHGSSGYDEGIVTTHRNRHPDGMTATQHQGYGGFA